MIYTSIDIGLFNLGLVVCEVCTEWDINIIYTERINIKELCTKCENQDCKFRHDLVFTDYINHFVEKYYKYLNNSVSILIERQPPQGFVAVQELIMNRFRENTVLISPNSVHKFFEIGHFDYEGRKKESIRIASEIHSFNVNEGRIHDIADAICMLIYHTKKMKKAHLDERLRLQRLDPFNKFRYCSETADKIANLDNFIDKCRFRPNK